MPPPVNGRKQTLVKPGSVTRAANRGRHVGGDALIDPKTISPAVVCNTMWMLDDYTEANGATLLVPGSHLSGRQPDHELDSNANGVPAIGPAGTAVAFEGRTWHTTGANITERPRIGLSTNFCAPQFRQQENFLLGTRPEVLRDASPELLDLIGFKAWQGYGGYENTSGQWVARVARVDCALGELQPERDANARWHASCSPPSRAIKHFTGDLGDVPPGPLSTVKSSMAAPRRMPSSSADLARNFGK